METNIISKINLGKEGVIEASAGTGKTYTIENLVIKILSGKTIIQNKKIRPCLENILLVTFTEKAAGEIKERVRANILKEIDSLIKQNKKNKDNTAEEILIHLEKQAQNYDTAQVYTIHSFCHSILKQYAFENGETFETELVDDYAVQKKILKDIIRKDWPNTYGNHLKKFLKLSGFPGNTSSGISEMESTILSIAGRFNPSKDTLSPEVPDDGLIPGDLIIKKILAEEEKIKNAFNKILPLSGKLSEDRREYSDIYLLYTEFKDKKIIRSNSVDTRLRGIFLPLINFLLEYKKSENLIDDYQSFLNTTMNCSGYNKNDEGYSFIFNGVLKDHKDRNLENEYPNLKLICDILNSIKEELNIDDLKQFIKASTIKKLIADSNIYKRNHAQISYNDMLTLVKDALYTKKSGTLLRILRSKYRYALIDEFQDTDSVQWEIFQKIFLESRDNRLFVIGDPKQSIYGFRGADIHTYMRAKQQILGNEKPYQLTTNWRSIPGLITALNELFKTWFQIKDNQYQKNSESMFNITYSPSEPPNESEARYIIVKDKTLREPVSIIDLQEADSLTKARLLMAEFIAGEISELLAKGFSFTKDGSINNLTAGDICILIRKRSEADAIENALNSYGIPHSFYKKNGLYSSDEALHIYYILKAIEKSDRNSIHVGLLTRFFNISLDKLSSFKEIPSDSKIRLLFEEWKNLSLIRQWGALFSNIIKQTGIFFLEVENSDAERRITNYIHIFQNLELEAVKHCMDLSEIVEYLNSLRTSELQAEENEDLHRLETEKPKVQIMTIHTSKGLEFPIVFLGGGFSEKAEHQYPYWEYYNNKKSSYTFDLTKSAKYKNLHFNNLLEEQKRLYYVALTRSIFKLYIPKYNPEKQNNAGAICRLIFPAIINAWGDKPLKTGLVSEIRPMLNHDNIQVHKKDISDISEQIELPSNLFLEASMYKNEYLKRRLEITSFSNIKNAAGEYMTYYGDEENEKQINEDDDDSSIPEEEGRILIPRGANSGTMFHSILEEIDFEAVYNSGNIEETINISDKLLTEMLDKYRIKPVSKYFTANNSIRDAFLKAESQNKSTDFMYKELEKRTARIIYNTLTTPLKNNNGETILELGQIKKNDKIHELEFYYPVSSELNELIPDIKKTKDGFVTGFIDMVFRHEGKYYILDWKSNYLDNYSNTELVRDIAKHNYDLQYLIYSVAVKAWLRQKIKNFKEDDFGGVFYIYIRGTQGKTEPALNNGIFFDRPEDSKFKKILESVKTPFEEKVK